MTKVLMADSAELFRALQNSFLKRSSCDVITASCLEEAEERARALAPDLILLDIMMPDMDGWAAYQQLRQASSATVLPPAFGPMMPTIPPGGTEKERFSMRSLSP